MPDDVPPGQTPPEAGLPAAGLNAAGPNGCGSNAAELNECGPNAAGLKGAGSNRDGPHAPGLTIAGSVGRLPLTFVPGLGGVRWPEAAIDNYAAALAAAHMPDRSRVRVRWRWRIVPRPVLQSSTCVCCGLDWPCPAAAWATDRLG